MPQQTIDIRDSLAFTIHRYARLQRWHFLSLMEGLGVTLSQEQWFVLNRLYLEGPKSQTELTDKIFSDRPNLTRIVTTLEKKRLISRKKDPNDGRKILCTLTQRGKSLHGRIEEIALRAREHLFETLEASDVAATRRVLAQLEAQILKT